MVIIIIIIIIRPIRQT